MALVNDSHDLPDIVRRRLASPLPGRDAQLRMAPRPSYLPDPAVESSLRPAAALLLLYQHHHAWHLPLTVRGTNLRHHTGQVSLPGGRLDHPGESVEAAALREAFEEIGVVPGEVEILGRLTPIPIVVSGHLLQPIVGVVTQRPRSPSHIGGRAADSSCRCNVCWRRMPWHGRNACGRSRQEA